MVVRSLALLAVVGLVSCGSSGPAPGPAPGQVCTLIGCPNEVQAEIPDLTARFETGFPLTAALCFNSTCGAVLVRRAEPSPICQAASPGDDSTVPALVCLPAPPHGIVLGHPLGNASGLKDGARVELHLRLSNGSGQALLDRTQTVVLRARYPNGPQCGAACLSGRATF